MFKATAFVAVLTSMLAMPTAFGAEAEGSSPPPRPLAPREMRAAVNAFLDARAVTKSEVAALAAQGRVFVTGMQPWMTRYQAIKH